MDEDALTTHFPTLEDDKSRLQQEIGELNAKITRYYQNRPNLRPNFDIRDSRDLSVHQIFGVFVQVFTVRKQWAARAVERIAHDYLTSLVVNHHSTALRVINSRQFPNVSFICLDLIERNPEMIDDRTAQRAQIIVGPGMVIRPALSLVKCYNNKLWPVMELIFGNIFVIDCDNFQTASEMAFNPMIRKTCVTVTGKMANRNGVMHGYGVDWSVTPVLLELKVINNLQRLKAAKEKVLEEIEHRLRKKKHDEEDTDSGDESCGKRQRIS